jgi:hypothetical protein
VYVRLIASPSSAQPATPAILFLTSDSVSFSMP